MNIYKKILVLFICCLPVFVSAQENPNKKQKKIEAQKKKKEEEALINYQSAIKKHHKIQTKNTRKKMKQSVKKSKQNSPDYQPFFLKKWFSGKKNKS